MGDYTNENQKTETAGRYEMSEDKNIYTMGAQAYYTEAMKSIKYNRSVAVDEQVLKNLDNIAKKIADKYGYESSEFRKFAEKLTMLHDTEAIVKVMKRDNKRRNKLIKILGAISGVALIVLVVFLLDTSSFYANQGQYNYIYKRSLFGNAELYKQVPASGLSEVGNSLYFINADDNYMYKLSSKDSSDIEQILENKVSEFEIVNKKIYYINTDDDNKLYEMNLNGLNSKCIYAESCDGISAEKSNIKIIPTNDPQGTKIFNTDDSSISDAIIN